jgi:hypothetical protein
MRVNKIRSRSSGTRCPIDVYRLTDLWEEPVTPSYAFDGSIELLRNRLLNHATRHYISGTVHLELKRTLHLLTSDTAFLGIL